MMYVKSTAKGQNFAIDPYTESPNRDEYKIKEQGIRDIIQALRKAMLNYLANNSTSFPLFVTEGQESGSGCGECGTATTQDINKSFGGVAIGGYSRKRKHVDPCDPCNANSTSTPPSTPYEHTPTTPMSFTYCFRACEKFNLLNVVKDGKVLFEGVAFYDVSVDPTTFLTFLSSVTSETFTIDATFNVCTSTLSKYVIEICCQEDV